MPDAGFTQRDPMHDFDQRAFTVEGQSKPVFVSGEGPGVIILTEMPGITPYVLRFARWVREADFTVYLPNVFGDPGAPVTRLRTLRAAAQICISREFHLLRSNSSGPLADWLRGMAQLVHGEAGGSGIGAIGMCITGNFALSMMMEPVVVAPVLSQPSLPLNDRAGMHIAAAELELIGERLKAENLTVLGYRFSGDRYCRAARFDAYQAALSSRFEPTVLPDDSANPHSKMKNPHSVFTHHLVDADGELTRQAVDDVIAFLTQRLRGDGST